MTSEAEYIKQLEDTIESYMDMFSHPYSDEHEQEDLEWALEQTQTILKKIEKISGNSNFTSGNAYAAGHFVPLIASMRRKVKLETVFGKAAILENRRLRRLLKENGIDYEQ